MNESENIQNLKAKIIILEEENNSLTQNSEDFFLINTLFETTQYISNKTELYENLLEKLAVLKNIPFCALLYKTPDGFEVLSSYSIFSNNLQRGKSLKFDEYLFNNILYEVVKIPKDKIQLISSQLFSINDSFICTEILLFPFFSLLTGDCLLLMCDKDESGNRLNIMVPYLSYVVNRISERLDTYHYQTELHNLNHELEGRVIERTNELLELTKQLKNEIEERKVTEKKLITSEARLSEQNEKLVRAIAKAKEIDKLKSIFFANMSHELRTPLVGLLGFTEILEDELSGKHKDFATKIHSSGQRLLATLNELLTYSEIESENVTVNLTEIDIVRIINDEIDLFNIAALKKKLSIVKKYDISSLKILSDEKLVRSICNNIINNAIKYTFEGSITVSIAATNKNVNISITDTGIGIPKNKQKVIFQEFRQVSEGIERYFDGTGLGLSIVKKYCELLKGSVEVVSDVDKGSTFIVVLPIMQYKQNENQLISETKELFKPLSAEAIQKKSILIVDDEEMNIDIIKLFLKNYYQIDTTTNGLDAIDKAKNRKYDCILMDINLKREMSGLEAAKSILLIPGYKKTPIVAITAFAMESDKEEFLAAGCSHYISKPFKKQQLLDLLSNIFTSTVIP